MTEVLKPCPRANGVGNHEVQIQRGVEIYVSCSCGVDSAGGTESEAVQSWNEFCFWYDDYGDQHEIIR